MLRFALSLRFIMLIAAIGTPVGALVMFWEGSVHMLDAAYAERGGDRRAPSRRRWAAPTRSCSASSVIFAYNIAFGFVFELNEGEQQRLPAWDAASGCMMMKTTLVGVIFVYLVVDFGTHRAEKRRRRIRVRAVKLIFILPIAGTYRLLVMPEPGDNQH